jgi:hypothetical protein
VIEYLPSASTAVQGLATAAPAMATSMSDAASVAQSSFTEWRIVGLKDRHSLHVTANIAKAAGAAAQAVRIRNAEPFDLHPSR